MTYYEIHDDGGRRTADTLADAIRMADAPADIFQISRPASMPAHGETVGHQWRLDERRKLTQIR